MTFHVLVIAVQILVTSAPADVTAALREPAVVQQFHELVADSGFGRMDIEVAAFLVRREDSWSVVRWEATRQFRRQQFTGAIPAGTVAIVHTHHRSQVLPSSTDHREAKRLGLPIVVLTPENITVAEPGGTAQILVRHRFWGE